QHRQSKRALRTPLTAGGLAGWEKPLAEAAAIRHAPSPNSPRWKMTMLQCPIGRRSWAVSRLLLCAATFAFAFGHLAIASDVTAPIEQLDAGLLQVMKAGKGAPFQQRYDILAPLVTRAVDLDGILQDGVGPGWASLPPAQQMVLKAAFQRYSIATYVSHFDDF